jgi:hypothetical protein
MLIVLINKVLNLHEGSLSQSSGSIRVYLCYLVKVVLSHVLVSVLDEYISGYLTFYKNIIKFKSLN